MVNECARCHINGEKARLFDVIYETKMGMLCERCAIIENIPIIKKPDTNQLKKSEKSTDVYERMKRLSGYKDPGKEDVNFRKERLIELEQNPKLSLPIKEQLNLVEHFHWDIMKSRRRKGLSHRQLAEAIGESEIAIDMLEKGKLPENAEGLIKKLEQFFQINLRKITEAEAMALRKQRMVRTKPVLLDEDGNELDHIPEPELESGEPDIYLESREVKETKEVPWYKKILGKKKEMAASSGEDSKIEEEEASYEMPEPDEEKPLGNRYLEYRRRERKASGEKEKPVIELKDGEDLDLDKVDLGRVRIGELKELHKKRVSATKQEKAEEQKKIEEKQRLVEARKEELRMMKEKESRNIDEVLGGSELLKKKKQEDEFTKSLKEFDEELS